jgi:hypothetical protein
VIAALIGLALAAALPEGRVRYRVEIGGEPVGVAELASACAADRCAASWETRLRAPADAGGAVAVRRVDVEVDRDGRFRGGTLRVAEGGAVRKVAGVPGAVPATVAELALLAALPASGERCLDAFDEVSGERGWVCARQDGGEVAARLLGAEARIVPGPGGFPSAVRIPAQGTRYEADPRAALPSDPPRLHGTAVPGPPSPEGALRFCGLDADPPPAPLRAAPGSPSPPAAGGERGPGRGGTEPSGTVPSPDAPGANCRERTAAWLARAAEAGLAGRTALGVAWDGSGFAWHAWAEVRVGAAWVPVDPTFRQAPARGPRFTVARFARGDEAARLEAGRRILACWGRARVERIER